MASWLDAIYQRSPVWLQNAEVSAFGYLWRARRLGGEFRSNADRFTARERQSPEQWRTYQRDQLRALLVHCLRTVPHYSDLFPRLGLTQADLENFELEDLRRLPVLEKNEVRERPLAFLSTAPSGKLHEYATSGSTGTPLVVRKSSRTQQLEYAAYEARCRRWAGVDFRMSRAMIGGRLVVPKAASEPPFWRYNAAEKQVYFSAFHISPRNAPHYAAALNRYRPDYLVGYASSHYFLARMIQEQGLAVHQPRAVLTSSEKLTPEMRATLEAVYRCPVFDGYSGVETCCMASECPEHTLHVSPDVGIVELLGADGQPVPAGHSGELVATGLLNRDQPLVRYRTNDLAIASPDSCACGRAMPVLAELVGRLEDTVFGADGREMVRFHGIFIGIPGIREGQVIQESLTGFTLRIVAPQGLAEDQRQLVQARMATRLGPVQVTLELVDQIERTERGKFKAVICRLPREQRAALRGAGPEA